MRHFFSKNQAEISGKINGNLFCDKHDFYYICNMKQRLYILLFVLLAFTCARGSSNVIIAHYATEQGLANNIVNCSVKGRDGFLWFGTWYGLCRFDGSNFRTFSRAEVDGSDQPPRKIESIVEDASGYLWLKTKDWKLCLFDDRTERFINIYDEIKPKTRNIQIIKIQPCRYGGVLILTKDKTLLHGVCTLVRNKKGDTPKISIERCADNKLFENPLDYTLIYNAVRENGRMITYVGKDFSIEMIRKHTAKRLVPRNIYFSCVATDKKGCMYLGGFNGSLTFINPQKGTSRIYQLPSAPLCISPANNGLVYIATKDGIFKYDLNRKKISRLPVSCRGENVKMFIGRDSRLWVYSEGIALNCYNPKTESSNTYFTPSFGHICEPKLAETRSHGVYFLTSTGEALHINNNGSMEPAIESKDESAKSTRFFDMNLDYENLLWLSSTNNGVYRLAFPSQQFRIITMPSPEANAQSIRSLFQMDNGDVWVGTRSKDLFLLNSDGSVKKKYPYDEYHIGSVYYTMKDRRGRLWFSTKGDGLFMAVKGKGGDYTFTKFTHNEKDVRSLSGNNVYTTFEDSRGRIWVGTLDGGLNLINEVNGKIIFINKLSGLDGYPRYGLYTEVRNISEDRWGRIWVGTIDGLMSFKTDFANPKDIKMETYRRKDLKTIANSDVYTLYTDAEKNVWMSAFVGGLSKINGYDEEKKEPEFETIDKQNGLRSDVILSIADDRHGRLWLGTVNGLSCFDKKNKTVTNYDSYDGLPNIQLEETSALSCKNGEIWIGSRNGIIAFNPNKLTTTDNNWPTYIIRCEVNNQNITDKALPYTKVLTLKHNENMFTLEFATLNFTSQDRISYRYRLDGYDHDWHYSGTNRIASYTNVPPGEYTFQVQAMRGNDSTPSQCFMQIKILPPWWGSLWAYIIYTILFCMMVYGASRLALYIIRMKNTAYINDRLAELKVKFFTNVSHELRTPLTLIQGSIHEIKNKEELSSNGKEYLAMMEKNSQRMIRLVNQILDLRKIQTGRMRLHVSHSDICSLVGSFRSEFAVKANERHIDYLFSLPQDEIMIWIDSEYIGIVVRNILSNAFKFTPEGGIIKVIVNQSNENECLISVENSGSHVPEDKTEEIFTRFSQADIPAEINAKGSGIGLALTREIVILHGGKINAENTDNGVRFNVLLPADREHFSKNEVDFIEDIDDTHNTKDITDTPDEAEADDSSKPFVLFVDDNTDLCRMITLQLSDRYHIKTANNGKEALALMNENEPDIVVSDQMMPEMDGMELLKKIRENFATSHIPVVMLTAKDDDESKIEAMNNGANNYLTKPFNSEYLIACIDQLISQRTLFRRWIIEDSSSNDDYVSHLEERDREFIAKIHHIFDDHISDEDFNMDAIAQEVGMSRSSLFKKVKSLTGLSPIDLVKEYRLNKAEVLLRTTDYTISDVAYKSGFSDVSYFGKCFKKKYEMTPREYREPKDIL